MKSPLPTSPAPAIPPVRPDRRARRCFIALGRGALIAPPRRPGLTPAHAP